MFYLRDFKNFAEAKLDDDRPVTLLVGPNGAGKSNLIEAIELLSFLASGRPLHEITDLGRGGGVEIRGSLEACAAIGKTEFTLGYAGKLDLADGPKDVEYEISVQVGKEPRIVREFLRLDERDIRVFEIVPPDPSTTSADNLARYDNNDRGKNKPTASIAADRSALSQYARFARKNKKLDRALELIDALTVRLTAPSVFDPLPKLMRGFERETEVRLARNGFNISPVLADLFRRRFVLLAAKRSQDPNARERRPFDLKSTADRILKRISQLPDEPWEAFDFVRTKAGDVMFGFKSPNYPAPLTARLVSDGTLRALAFLTALETTGTPGRLVLEEFDNGVHPSRVHILTEALFECAERRDLRALATTHNPATLNALTDAQMGAVLFVVQDARGKRARLLPLKDLPGYVEFVEQGRLGDLITRRIYERHLDSDYESKRTQDVNKWLEALP